MGEVADMMLDGTLCQMCGEYMDGTAYGYPVSCAGCVGDEPKVAKAKKPKPKTEAQKEALRRKNRRRRARKAEEKRAARKAKS